MPRTPNPDILREDNYKDELENMVGDIDEMLGTDSSNIDLPNQNHTSFMDFEKVKTEANERSSEIVDSIVEFYLDARIYDGPEGHRFLKNKTDMDKLSISNLIFQMRTAEHAITKLLEEIDSGNMHPRQFEVLASLQKSKMDIVKHLAFVTIQMENNYKIIRQEYDNLYQNKDDDRDDSTQIGGIGTKGLLQEMRKKMLDKEMNLEVNLEEGNEN